LQTSGKTIKAGARPLLIQRWRSIEQIDVFQQFAKAACDGIAVDRFAAGQLARKTANQNTSRAAIE